MSTTIDRSIKNKRYNRMVYCLGIPPGMGKHLFCPWLNHYGGTKGGVGPLSVCKATEQNLRKIMAFLTPSLIEAVLCSPLFKRI